MEETIGYEALFSPEEWAGIDFSDDEGSGGPPEGGPDAPKHTVTVLYPPGDYVGNETRYELECDVCDHIGAAETLEEAQAIARLHEAFVATLVEKWSVDR